MRMTLLSALFALGVGIAGVSAANAAPAAAIDGAQMLPSSNRRKS